MKINTKISIFTFLPFLFFIAGYGLSSFFWGSQPFPTPDLIGKTVHEAITISSALHVNIQLLTEKEVAGITPGLIINQKPTAGRLIKPHQSILITTSKPLICSKIPDLSEIPSNQIQDFCKNHKLKCKIIKIPHTAPTGTFLGQYPAAGSSIIDQKITIYNAINNDHACFMPNLTGQKLHDVITFLQFYPVTIQAQDEHAILKPPFPETKFVIAQKPEAGSIINLEKRLCIQLEVA